MLPRADAAPAFDRPSIIGGTVAPPKAWPFVVGLLAAGVKSNFAAQFCAGTLIGPRHVLTAAHCVDGAARDELQILVRTQDLSSGGKRIDVARIVMHPGYDDETGDNDVAVIRLETPVRGIRPARLLGFSGEAAHAAAGAPAMTVGWGDTRMGNLVSYPSLLHQVRIRIVPTRRCNRPESYDGGVTSTMICAGTMAGGRDSCQGDSGGPLLVRDRRGHYTIQAGIVSWGEGCARPNFPGVYSRVARLKGWIRSVVAGGS